MQASIPLLPLGERKKRYRVTADKTVTEFVDYTQIEQERFLISQFQLWGDIEGYRKPADVLETTANLSKVVDMNSEEEKSATKRQFSFSDKGNQMNIETNEDAIAEQQKLREKGIEHLKFALGEMSQMLTLTTLLNNKEYFTYAVKDVLQKQDSNGRLPRGIPLPIDQLISVYRTIYSRNANRLQEKRLSMEQILFQRKKYLSGISELRKHWRIVRAAKSPFQKSSDNKGIETTSVDCSYSCFGDFQELLVSSTVPSKQLSSDAINSSSGSAVGKVLPLLIGDDGPILSQNELERALMTLQVTIKAKSADLYAHAKDSNGSSAVDIAVASADCWTMQHAVRQANEETVAAEIRVLHKQLISRQHDIFCRRMFVDMKNDAIRSSTRWMVTPSTGRKETEDVDGSFDRLGNLLMAENLSNSLDIFDVNSHQFTVKLSDSLSVTIALVKISSIQPTSSTTPAAKNHPAQVLTNILRLSLCRAQCALLHQFSLNMRVKDQVIRVQQSIDIKLATITPATTIAAKRQINLEVQEMVSDLLRSLSASKLTRSHLCPELSLQQQISDSRMRWQSDLWLHSPNVSVLNNANTLAHLSSSGMNSSGNSNSSNITGSSSALSDSSSGVVSSSTASSSSYTANGAMHPDQYISGILQSILYVTRCRINALKMQSLCQRIGRLLSVSSECTVPICQVQFETNCGYQELSRTLIAASNGCTTAAPIASAELVEQAFSDSFAVTATFAGNPICIKSDCRQAGFRLTALPPSTSLDIVGAISVDVFLDYTDSLAILLSNIAISGVIRHYIQIALSNSVCPTACTLFQNNISEFTVHQTKPTVGAQAEALGTGRIHTGAAKINREVCSIRGHVRNQEELLLFEDSINNGSSNGGTIVVEVVFEFPVSRQQLFQSFAQQLQSICFDGKTSALSVADTLTITISCLCPLSDNTLIGRCIHELFALLM